VNWSVVGNRPSKSSARRQTVSRNDRRRAAIEQRREAARRLARRDAQRRRRRLIVIPLAVAVVLLAGGGIFALVQRGGGGGPTQYSLTSELAAGSSGDFAISTTPAAYHLVYKVDNFGSSATSTSSASSDGGTTTTTQEYTIRRPFDAHLVSKAGAPPGTDEQWSLIWNLGKYGQTTSGGSPEVGQVAPQAALGDIRLDATLTDLVADAKFVAKERRIVLGRECQVYRTGQAVETLSVAAPTNTDYAEACIDSDGLLLEEVVVSSGKLAERLIATSVDDQTAPADSVFTITGDPTPLAQGGSQLSPIDATTKPADGYWGLATPPTGYTLQGRYVLQTPADQSASDTSASTTTTSTTAPPAPVPSYVDVYVNGPDTIIVRQGPTAGEPQSDATQGTSVDLGALGSAPLGATLTGSHIVAHPAAPAAWYVELQGTVGRDTLKQVASQLTQ
jgi:hypothetical protein